MDGDRSLSGRRRGCHGCRRAAHRAGAGAAARGHLGLRRGRGRAGQPSRLTGVRQWSLERPGRRTRPARSAVRPAGGGQPHGRTQGKAADQTGPGRATDRRASGFAPTRAADSRIGPAQLHAGRRKCPTRYGSSGPGVPRRDRVVRRPDHRGVGCPGGPAQPGGHRRGTRSGGPAGRLPCRPA